MRTLVCVVVGEGRPFSVKIEANEIVSELKKKIKDENKNTVTCDAKELELYRVDGLTQDEDEQIVYNGTTIDMANYSLDFFGEDKAKMPPLSLISECFNAAEMNTRWKIHVLVVVPEGAVAARTSHAQAVEFQDAVLREMRRQMQIQTEVLTAILPH
ncbi:hypothetical protein As57867_017279, partial [Aphanomyces stellatus]